MVDFRKAVQAVLIFFTGTFVSIIGWYIIPILIETMSFSETLKGIFYVGLILIGFLTMIVIPGIMMVEASKG